MWKKIKPYLISILIPLAVGGLSALLTKTGMKEYTATEIQPPLSPPEIVFPIVWTILFILMGIGSAIVFLKRDTNTEEAYEALKIYAFQLIINFFWSIIFFNMKSYLFAFIWIILLWISILIMIFKFRKVSPVASYIQIPYLLWVTFASYLTLMTYVLNR